jgi:hypothetical protein
MQKIMEPIFEIPYLIGVVALGLLILKRGRSERQFFFFGIMAVVLGCGDAFHLIPRMWALFTAGVTNLPEQAAPLGFGKLVTSVTMTVFYVLLFHVWQFRYKKWGGNLVAAVYFLAAVRIVLCFFPQNDWFNIDAPLSWGIIRNVPFVILGAVIVSIYLKEARNDKPFRFMWLAITLSFLFYIPVVLFADAYPMIGMLMIPKTCAYVWIVVMGYRAAKKEINVTA